MSGDAYLGVVRELLDRAAETQREQIGAAARLVAGAIRGGGLVHLFGCGHSALVAEELFFRSGGLVPLNLVVEPSLLHQEGALKSILLERLEGYAATLLAGYQLRAGDAIVVVSNSGINAVPIDVALEAKARGLSVIVVTSIAHTHMMASRHSRGIKLHEVADVVLDNCGVPGDAAVTLPGYAHRIGSTSTVIGAALLHATMCEASVLLVHDDIEPPVWISSNVAGGDEHNERYLRDFRGRIKHLA